MERTGLTNTLVTAAVAGDRPAISQLLRYIRPLMVRYCRARVASSPDDVAQNICLAILTALPNYRDQGRPFLAFAYGIAAHKVADANRSRSSLGRVASEILEISKLTEQSSLGRPAAVASKQQSSGQHLFDGAMAIVNATLEEHGMARHVRDQDRPEYDERPSKLNENLAILLSLLPEKQREIVVLRVVVGLSAEETAEAVGSTPGAVRVAQARAIGRLRKEIAESAMVDYVQSRL